MENICGGKSLVPLSEAFYYMAAAKLGNCDVCVEDDIKLDNKFQLRTVCTFTLLTRMEALWKQRYCAQ